MRDRLKILDCNRKNVLGLPSGAFHLWFCYYMAEDEEQESFMSYAEIEAQTGMSKTSIQKWNHYLVRHGWLIDTGKTAFDKWLALGKQPTADSKRITCWKTTDQSIGKQPTSQSENDHKVYSYGSGSGYSSGSRHQDWPKSSSTSVSHGSGPDSTPLENLKPQTKTNGSLAPDGTSWSEWDAHDQAWHTAKLIELGITKAGPSAPARKEKTKTRKAAARQTLREFLESGEDDFTPRCAYVDDNDKRCWGDGEFDGYCVRHTDDL